MTEKFIGKYYDSRLEKEVDFEYIKELTMKQKIDFVNNVLETLFQNDYYYSIIKDELINIMLINSFTNIFIMDEDFSFTINNIDEFLSNTNAVDVLLEEIPSELIKELHDVIDKNIIYKTGINENSLSTVFSSLLKTIEEKVSVFDMEGLANTLKEFGDITNNFSQEEIMNLYTKTADFKKNYEGVIQSKNKEIRNLKK